MRVWIAILLFACVAVTVCNGICRPKNCVASRKDCPQGYSANSDNGCGKRKFCCKKIGPRAVKSRPAITGKKEKKCPTAQCVNKRKCKDGKVDSEQTCGGNKVCCKKIGGSPRPRTLSSCPSDQCKVRCSNGVVPGKKCRGTGKSCCKKGSPRTVNRSGQSSKKKCDSKNCAGFRRLCKEVEDGNNVDTSKTCEKANQVCCRNGLKSTSGPLVRKVGVARQNSACNKKAKQCTKQLKGKCQPLGSRCNKESIDGICGKPSSSCTCCFKKCKNKKKCNENNGTCQTKFDTCNGITIKKGCKTSRKGCVCCADCQIKGKCKNAGGTCTNDANNCPQGTTASSKGCKGPNCVCCVPGEPSQVWDRSCRMEYYGHYFAQGCTPMGDGPCPQYFSCPNITRDPTKCLYNGISYDNGDTVPVTLPCAPGCFCSSALNEDGSASLNCAIVDCAPIPEDPNGGLCMPLYSHEQCCHVGSNCSSDFVTAAPNTITCNVLNQPYLAGQYISYEEYPCQSCICEEGHDGPFGPGCQPVDCGFDVWYTYELASGCVPVYYDRRCCPISWKCPTEDSNTPQGNQNEVCQFGNLQFAKGEEMEQDDCRIICSCVTPPQLTCIQYKNCEVANNIRNSTCPDPDSFGIVCIQYFDQCQSSAECGAEESCCLVAGCGKECMRV